MNELAEPALDPGLADVRTLLSHRRTWLSILAGCLLIIRLAALRPLWVSFVVDPVCLVVAVAAFTAERRAWRVTSADHWSHPRGHQRELRDRMMRGLVLRLSALGLMAVFVLALAPR
jgi:hypothetical protein